MWSPSSTRPRQSPPKPPRSAEKMQAECAKASPSKRVRFSSFSFGQALLLATGASSITAVVTALAAVYSLTLQFEAFTSSLLASSIASYHPIGNPIPLPDHTASSCRDDNPTKPVSFLRRARSQSLQINHDPPHQDRLLYGAVESNTVADDGVSPKVAWLMSFPNSGTSFTLHMTREASNCTTATNYALEGEIRDKPSVPAIASSDGENGPWLELIPNRVTNSPKFILTKTHCGGFCNGCHPRTYIETPRSFQLACQSGTKAVLTEKGLVLKPVTYNASLVHKAIHIIRHPLDNIVARFHLDYNRAKASGNHTYTSVFSNSKSGFNRWCKFHDGNNEILESRLFDRRLVEALKDVPCKAEFYRYVQWHNLAFSVTHNMGLPTLVMHYHDYRDFERTLLRVLTFLELPRVAAGMEFHEGKEYRSFYSKKQKQAVRIFLQEAATKETWKHLEEYEF